MEAFSSRLALLRSRRWVTNPVARACAGRQVSQAVAHRVWHFICHHCQPRHGRRPWVTWVTVLRPQTFADPWRVFHCHGGVDADSRQTR
jgi:hypothetical protein